MTDGTSFDWTNKTEVEDLFIDYPDVMQEELFRALSLIGEMLRTATVELAPTGIGSSNWGHMANAITVNQPRATIVGWEIEYGLPVGHSYGAVIEHGRTPGSTPPPIAAITEWIWGKRWAFPTVETEEDAKKLAFPIAKHIGRHGFSSAPMGQGKGWAMFERAQAQSLEKVNAILQDARNRITDRLNFNSGGL